MKHALRCVPMLAAALIAAAPLVAGCAASGSGDQPSATPSAAATAASSAAPEDTAKTPEPTPEVAATPVAPPEIPWQRMTNESELDNTKVEIRWVPSRDGGGAVEVRITPGEGFYVGGADYPPTKVAIDLPAGLSVADNIQTTSDHVEDGQSAEFTFAVSGTATAGAEVGVSVSYVSCTTDGTFCLPPARASLALPIAAP